MVTSHHRHITETLTRDLVSSRKFESTLSPQDSYATFTNSAPKSCSLCKHMQQQPPEIKLANFAQQALSDSFIYILPVNRLQELLEGI